MDYPEIRHRITNLSTEINTNHHMQLATRYYDEKAKLVEECRELERERRRYLEMQEKFIPD